MSRRRREDQTEAPGSDSFLDVVANLVGILIILVVVVGAGTKSAAMAVAKQTLLETPQPLLSETDPELDVDTARETGAAIERGIHELEAQIKREQATLARRDLERNQVQTLVTVAEQRLKEHRDGLKGIEQAKYDVSAELTAAKGEFEHLERAKTAKNEVAPPAVLEHYPTPMARTVFGKELHFRLLGGRLTFIPWDELIAALKQDAPNKVHRLRDQQRVEESLPPFGGFVLKYAIKRTDAVLQTRDGRAAQQSRVELDRFVLIPVQEPMGETLADALGKQYSELRSRLSENSPRNTTLTVWVYPDSFNEFRILKGEMFKLGYLTAARPLPEGLPIGGSPDGVRSTAE